MTAIKKYSGPWGSTQVKHLCRRSLFGCTADDYAFFKDKSMDECIELLLTPSPAPPPPLYYDDDDPDVKPQTTWVFDIEKPEREEHRMMFLRSWMIGLMRYQQKNVTERMVMFWHNHFATEFNTVKDTRYNYQYFALMREHAIGNFKLLLKQMTLNTQMLVYLNGNQNYKANPNENFAREVQELFTVGKGPGSHYTEDDVKNAAKVLTGWKDDKINIRSYFNEEFHNTDDKKFSAFYNNYVIKGRSGPDGAEETTELLDMICRQQETAKFMCRKLYRWFVCSNIDEATESNIIGPLADIMVASDYEIKPVLKAILSGDFFYDPRLIGGIVKSPIDFVVEIARNFTITNPLDPGKDFKMWFFLSWSSDSMGQHIGDPPAVAGWPAYYEYPLYDKEWISSDRLFGRNNLIKILTRKLDKLEPENNVCIDMPGFVSKLANPGSYKQVIAETVDALFCIPLGKGQISYLENLLNKGVGFTESWDKLWPKYDATPDKTELKNEVNDRLRSVFQAMLTFPEYQIR